MLLEFFGIVAQLCCSVFMYIAIVVQLMHVLFCGCCILLYSLLLPFVMHAILSADLERRPTWCFRSMIRGRT